MPDYIIQPFVGVGPVRLGMSRDEVQRAMHEPSKPFRKSVDCRYDTDAFHQSAFQVFYNDDDALVEYIELSGGSMVRALYKDIDIFVTPADDVVARIARDTAFDPNEPEIPYSYVFPELQLSLWRPVIPESDTDAEGRHFSTIGIGRRGYYDVD